MKISSWASIQHIQNWFIEYPDPGAPYFFSTDEPDLEGQVKQASTVDELLGHKTNGFFVECGAFDGEIFSNTLNTLWTEEELDWAPHWAQSKIQLNPSEQKQKSKICFIRQLDALDN